MGGHFAPASAELNVRGRTGRPRTRNSLGVLGRVSANECWGYLFIAPWQIGFFVFTLGPFLASLYLSFTDYKLVGAPVWVGLKNYQTMFSSIWSDQGDIDVWTSLKNTAYYTSLHVPLAIILSFFIALLLNARVRALP